MLGGAGEIVDTHTSLVVLHLRIRVFYTLRITPKSRAKVCAQLRILKPPDSLLATDRSKAVVLV